MQDVLYILNYGYLTCTRNVYGNLMYKMHKLILRYVIINCVNAHGDLMYNTCLFCVPRSNEKVEHNIC